MASTYAAEVLLGWLRGCRGSDAPPAYRREKLGSEFDFHAVVCEGDGQGLQGFGDLEDAADMPIHVVVKHDGAKLAFFEGRQVFRGFKVRAFAHGEVEWLVLGKFGGEVVCRFARQVAGEQHALALGFKQVGIGCAAMLSARGGDLQEAVVVECALGNRFKVNFLAHFHPGGVIHAFIGSTHSSSGRKIVGFAVLKYQLHRSTN